MTALSTDERIVWLGADRFAPQGTLPAYVFSVPGLLEIPVLYFNDEDGESIDQLLELEGYDGGLDKEVANISAQDVLDQEVAVHNDNPATTARVIIKNHHKQYGTMPLCQFPSSFFPSEPKLLEVDFALPNSQKATVWINNETQLLFGLLDWFNNITIDSGAVFTLERLADDKYQVGFEQETEPTMFISRNRISELILLQEKVEQENLATFEIVREIMEHYRKGIEYITLLTEVNVVRRVTRAKIASILSKYHCFFQRGGAWVYDAKKLSQGFDKSKRKYLIR